MKIGKMLVHFVKVFILAFLSTAAVTALYGRIVHGACGVNFENAIIFGILFGILFTWLEGERLERDEDEQDNPYD
ncbi:MAG: hypothetical protein WCT23_09525 [Candidatus Neomarinimicrobiota bacterium]